VSSGIGSAGLRRAWWIAVFVAAVIESSTAHAQQAAPDGKVAAQALFDEAIKLMQAGSFSQACPKLAESQKLDPAVGTLLYMGECYEHNGQFASAWAAFNSAESAARHSKQPEREKTARERAAMLEPRVSKLMVVVPDEAAAPGLEVTRDGLPLGSAAWGVAIPIDPGEHVVEVRAPGKKPLRKTVTIAANGATLKVVLPALEAEPSGLPPAAPIAAPKESNPGPPAARSTAPVRPRDEPPHAERGGTQRTLGTVTGILGAAGLAVGAVFGIRSQSKDDQAMKDYCSPGAPPECDPRGLELKDEAKSAATIANVGFIGGGSLLLVGVLLHATAPSPSPKRSSVSMAPSWGPGAGAVTIRGSW